MGSRRDFFRKTIAGVIGSMSGSEPVKLVEAALAGGEVAPVTELRHKLENLSSFIAASSKDHAALYGIARFQGFLDGFIDRYQTAIGIMGKEQEAKLHKFLNPETLPSLISDWKSYQPKLEDFAAKLQDSDNREALKALKHYDEIADPIMAALNKKIGDIPEALEGMSKETHHKLRQDWELKAMKPRQEAVLAIFKKLGADKEIDICLTSARAEISYMKFPAQTPEGAVMQKIYDLNPDRLVEQIGKSLQFMSKSILKALQMLTPELEQEIERGFTHRHKPEEITKAGESLSDLIAQRWGWLRGNDIY